MQKKQSLVLITNYDYKNLLKDNRKIFKNPENPRCIDLFITNSFDSFQNITTVVNSWSDIHKMIVIIRKNYFQKL